MVRVTQDLLNEYRSLKDPLGRIHRDLKSGKLFPLIRGVYETDKDADGMYLSSYILSPSYLSFEFALSHYQLIPERVFVYSNATYKKNKTKRFVNRYGRFEFRDVPAEAFRHDINVFEENGYVIFIASPEKAICDQLWKVPPVKNLTQLENLLFEDLRFDPINFYSLDINKIIKLSLLYKSRNLSLLRRFLAKGRKEYDNN